MFHVKQMAEDWQNGGFGLYIHWPFCQSKCPYCDFNSHVTQNVNHARWEAAYLAEIDRAAADTKGRVLQTVFFGGGTPSLMKPETVHAILSKVRNSWKISNDIEITMEANPTSVEAGRFQAYRDAGVNRVSVGVQALNDSDLKMLGRLHSVEEAVAAIRIAQATFDRSSFDLIYGRQNQTLEEWRVELTRALDLAGEHLSLYQLTVEDGTIFGERHQRGLLRGLPTEDLGADMYQMTRDMTARAGFHNYEVSNYAKDDAQSRHNCIYWKGGDYIGVGPGAHGRITIAGRRLATEAEKAPSAWLDLVSSGLTPESRKVLSPADQGAEYLMMGLRHSSGIDLARYTRITGRALDPIRIEYLDEIAMVECKDDMLVATSGGRLVLNAVIRHLVNG
jgi:putative oxygen-independent coproporphyrinogen III oxidase